MKEESVGYKRGQDQKFRDASSKFSVAAFASEVFSRERLVTPEHLLDLFLHSRMARFLAVCINKRRPGRTWQTTLLLANWRNSIYG